LIKYNNFRRKIFSVLLILVLVVSVVFVLDFGFVPSVKAADSTFGKTDIGESSQEDGANNAIACKFTCPEAGTLTKITMYLRGRDAQINAKTGLYSDSGGYPNNLLAESSPVSVGTTLSWVDFSISYSLEADTVYHLAVITDGIFGWKYDVGTAAQTNTDWDLTYPNFGNPWTQDQSQGEKEMSIYATYTPTGEETITGSITDLTYPYNTTKKNTVTSLKAKWTTSGTLHYWWASTDFADGINQVNGTAYAFSDTWSNFTGTLPNAIDNYYVYLYANTTTGIENVTDAITITTTSYQTQYLETLDSSTVQTALDAVSGTNATVYLPSTTAQWTGEHINITSSDMNLVGYSHAGCKGHEDDWEEYTATTIINQTVAGNIIRFNANVNNVNIKNIKFVNQAPENTTVESNGWCILSGDHQVYNITVGYCTFINFGGGAAMIGSSDYFEGSSSVFYNCVVDNEYKLTGSGWSLGMGFYVYGWHQTDLNWSTVDVYAGQFENIPSTFNVMYIEDCYLSRTRHATDAIQGGWQVTRFCKIDHPYPANYGMIDLHGTESNGGMSYVGGRGFEAYNNTVLSEPTKTVTAGVWHRGGSAIIYNNTFTCDVNSAYNIWVTLLNDDGGDYYPETQVNQTYVWDNSVTNGTNLSNEGGYTENVEYFLRAPNMEDDGFVYTPYPYPHPLVSSEEVTYYYLNITSFTGGTTDPAGGSEYPYLDGSYATVEAFPESGSSFTNWALDAGDGGSDNPTSIYMTENHTIQPNFVVNQSSAYTYSIDFTNQMVYVQLTYNGTENPVPSENCTFGGSIALTNSSGWAEFSLSGLSNFSYNSTAYPTSFPDNNMSIPLAKQTLAIQAINASNTISDLSYDSTQFSWSATGTGATSFKIYYPSTIYYVMVNGEIKFEGDGWSKTGSIVTVTDNLGSTHGYAIYSATEDDTPSYGFTSPLFPYLLEGDFIGFVFATYTTTIGSVFYAIGIFFVSAVIYIRQRSLFIVSIIWLFVGGSFIALFWEFSAVAVWFTLLGIAGLFAEFITVWRKGH